MASISLDSIAQAADRLARRFGDRLEVNPDLDRGLVSSRANRFEREHRWCKYKEGFSAPLVRYFAERLEIRAGDVLDPFAGAGTTLFVASDLGLDAVGIELLPWGAEIIAVKELLRRADRRSMALELREFARRQSWERAGGERPFPHLAITAGAFPAATERSLARFRHDIDRLGDPTLAKVLGFVALCVLESISFTRKDGQYLRWDSRAGRPARAKAFHKGEVLDFAAAMTRKTQEIADDLERPDSVAAGVAAGVAPGQVTLLAGSCLDRLSELPDHSAAALITSPPYCNRYDYTRTYALELAWLGNDAREIKSLRQAMLSCTVENRAKEGLQRHISQEKWEAARRATDSQQLLSAVVEYLEQCRRDGSLNNGGIPRMVRGYFLELAVLLSDCARVLKPGAPLIMVNDNVRYQGAHIPVDLVLADIAEKIGYDVERIWVLPRGKGNSSQQMGAHGRAELRKCVYVWRVKK